MNIYVVISGYFINMSPNPCKLEILWSIIDCFTPTEADTVLSLSNITLTNNNKSYHE